MLVAAELEKRISPHFTLEVLKNILQNKSGLTNIQIKNINIADASSTKGDSYLSTICRFTVNFSGANDDGIIEEGFFPIITKAIPKNVARTKTFRSADFFETEIYFYEKIWPLMKQLKISKNIADEIDEVPKMLSSWSDGLTDYLAFEDLSYKNFVSIDRSKGINYDHTLVLLKLLAKFHALSFACKQHYPEFEQIAKNTKETYFAEKYRAWYKNFQQNLMNTTLKAAKQHLSNDYVEKIEKVFSGDFFGYLCKLSEIHNEFSVISQGDNWLPNFLVKNDSDLTVPKQSVMIDFQLARYTTLSNDLTFYFYACVEPEIMQKHWNDLIEEYYKTLTERLIELDSKIPFTLEALKQEIDDKGAFGIGMAMEAVTMASLEEHEVVDLDLIQGDDAVPIESVWILPEFGPERNKRIAEIIKLGVDRFF